MPDFKLTRYRIRLGDGLREPQRPFTAVLLCDLHNVSFGEGNSRLLQAIRSEEPELVFVAGDMLVSTREPQMDAALSLMDALTKQYPVYCSNGNHEYRLKLQPEIYGDGYERYSETIRSFGVHLLENACARVEVRKMPLAIWGLELPLECYRRFGKNTVTGEQITALLGEPERECFNILLAHHPAYFSAYVSWGADLTLSGHLHGGIVRLPHFGGVISPQLKPFPRYDRGLFSKAGGKMVVSAGLGSHTIPIRINNPPELVALDFE